MHIVEYPAGSFRLRLRFRFRLRQPKFQLSIREIPEVTFKVRANERNVSLLTIALRVQPKLNNVVVNFQFLIFNLTDVTLTPLPHPLCGISIGCYMGIPQSVAYRLAEEYRRQPRCPQAPAYPHPRIGWSSCDVWYRCCSQYQLPVVRL